MLDEVQTATIDNMLQIGINHHNAGNLARAKQVYRQILDLDAEQPDANNLIAMVVSREGTLDEALQYVEQALKARQAEPMYWATKAEILKQKGDYIGAADSFWRGQKLEEAIQAIKLVEGNARETAEYYLVKARILQDMHEPREAEACLLQAQQLSPACKDPYPDDQTDAPVFKPMKVNEQLDTDLPNIQTPGFTYVIDIVGTCNLRCPSCPVGNTPRDQRDIGFMSVEMFEEILNKIDATGHLKKPDLWLFNWGEPLIHPDIGKIIRLCKQRGFSVFLSSNLNVDDGLKEAIREHPDQLKISLSGFNQDVYCQTHSKGHIDRVKGNMYLLKYFVEKYNAPTWVWVSYHMYRHNMDDYALMEKFSQELGFTFNPIMAFYQPLEKLVDLYEGRLPDDQKAVLDLLIRHPIDTKISKMPYYRKAMDCELRYNMISINFNGMVDLCCSSFNDENTIGVNYLDADFDEIQRRKYEHPFCATCYKHGLNYQPIEANGNLDINTMNSIMINNASRFGMPKSK